MDVLTAAIRIASLFPDDGASVLAEAGLPPTWEEALAGVPPRWLQAEGSTAEEVGERLLAYVREHFSQQNQLRAAIAITRALLRRRVATLGEEHPDTLVEVGALGALADRAGKRAEAANFLEQAYAGLRSVAGGRDLRLAVVASNLAMHYLRLGQAPKAEQCLDQAWRIRKDVAPTTTGTVAAQLAELLVRRGKTEEALPLLWEAWERYRDDFGPSDARTQARAKTLVAILVSLDREVESVPVLRSLYATSAGDPEQRAQIAFQLGGALDATGHKEEGFRLIEESLRWTREAGDPHPELAARAAAFSRLAMRRGRPIEAEGLMQEALEADRLVHGEDSAEVAVRYANLGHLYMQMGRGKEAIGFLEPAVSLLRGTVGDQHGHTRYAVELLVQLWLAEAKSAIGRKDHGLAREILMRADPLVASVMGPKHALLSEIRRFGLT